MEHFLLRWPVEVNQQVPAKDEVISSFAGQKIVPQDVALVKMNALAYCRIQHKPLFGMLEITVAELEVLAAKRVFAINRALSAGQCPRADIHTVDLEPVARHSGVFQRHRQRIRLLARRAREA